MFSKSLDISKSVQQIQLICCNGFGLFLCINTKNNLLLVSKKSFMFSDQLSFPKGFGCKRYNLYTVYKN